jgi:hypothetical protein
MFAPLRKIDSEGGVFEQVRAITLYGPLPHGLFHSIRYG